MKEQIQYYHKRAKEYELVYHKKERQADLQAIKDYLKQQFVGKSILEIACGTGYWTEILSYSAKSILASDINESVLDLAKQKNYKTAKLSFEKKSIEEFQAQVADFDGLFGGFIWSHIKKEEMHVFLQSCLDQVRVGGELIFIDNKYVEGSSTAICRKDQFGNTYQERKLVNGEKFEIVKNFPSYIELQTLLKAIDDQLVWIEWEYYWLLKFKKY